MKNTIIQKPQINFQVTYKDDWNKTHLAFVPSVDIKFYRQRFDVVDVKALN